MEETKAVPVGQIALAVAQCLTGKWTVKPQDDDRTSAELAREDGVSFYIHGPSYQRKDKLYIGGKWPQNPRTNQMAVPYGERPSIGVSPSRSPEQIAREIERRFLPAFVPLYAKMAEQIANDERLNDGAMDLARKVAEVLGKPITKDWRNDVAFSRYVGPATIDIQRSGYVKMEFRISGAPARVLALVKLAAKWEAEDEAATKAKE